MKRIALATMSLTLALPGAAAAQSLDDWNYDQLYRDGISIERMLDGMDVHGTAEQDIGEVEDVLIGSDGKVVALIAEVGGFWDMGDTHVSVPWRLVDKTAFAEGLTVPITEENADEYSLFDREYLTKQTAKADVVSEVDDATPTGQMWRASNVIGDYARVRDGEAWAEYGYVNDLIVRDGKIASVVVTPDVSYGVGGYRAYPYAGVYDGWTAGDTYYDLPYTVEEIDRVEAFDYDSFAWD